jgi:glycosyltransferase involved in cell wall biosynthesis
LAKNISTFGDSILAAGDKVVCVLCPGGLEHSGGIGRVMGYIVDCWETEAGGPTTRVLDTRGAGHIALAPVHFVRALLAIVGLAVRGRVRLLHINLSSHGSTARKVVAMALASLLNIRSIIHLHGSRFDVFYRELPLPGQKIVKWMFSRADRVIVLGKYWHHFVVSEMGTPPEKLEIVFNGVPDPAMASRERGAAGTKAVGPPHILFLGRLGERKGVPELLSALQAMAHQGKPWRATLAGDGPVEDYRERVALLRLEDRIALPGWVDRECVDALLATADIVVLPSYQENQPMSVIEGLAHRIAVVTTPVGALPDILSDGENSLIVQPGDVSGLLRALERLIDNPALRAKIATGGRLTFLRKLDVRIAASRLEKIYEEVDGGGQVAAKPLSD